MKAAVGLEECEGKIEGILAPGKFADITVFHPLKVADTATWENPVQKPAGIDCVFVNGSMVAEHNDVKNIKSGRIVIHKNP